MVAPSSFRRHGIAASTSLAVPCLKLVVLALSSLPYAGALPVHITPILSAWKSDAAPDATDASLWIYLATAVVLVLLGGALAGLTIALMGQDETYLQVIATSGTPSEMKNASRVLWLLRKGKHWVLVTLLLGNVITNETLPIVLDRSIGGGWPAVAASTALVVIFGEIAPQSVCVRYGLPIGAFMAPFTLVLMWLLFPISWPIAKLLDYLLGQHHGTTYKKAGLKQLVSLHGTLGQAPNDRLNEDEVLIIGSVLDLKDKAVGSIMTPIDDTFTLSANAVLDEELMEVIMQAGYSRIPIYEPSNPSDFVGMLLVKMLITYDPEDAKRVSDFQLATLPETRAATSCLDIINFFQQGKSHMVLVSECPGESYGALGVVTLEDVIEELIGEEITDETDVSADIPKVIRRMAPAPMYRSRAAKGEVVMPDEPDEGAIEEEEDLMQWDEDTKDPPRAKSFEYPRKGGSVTSINPISNDPTNTPSALAQPQTNQQDPRAPSRRRSSADVVRNAKTMQIRGYSQEVKDQLKNLGPSNPASRPMISRVETVKIKKGLGTVPEKPANGQATILPPDESPANPAATSAHDIDGPNLINPGHAAKDGVQAVAAVLGFPRSVSPSLREARQAGHTGSTHRTPSRSTVGSLPSLDGRPGKRSKFGVARSGSITEQIIDVGGVRKIILDTTSSSDTGDEDHTRHESESSRQSKHYNHNHNHHQHSHQQRHTEDHEHQHPKGAQHGKKKQRKKRGPKKRSGSADTGGEATPLLTEDHS